MTGAAYCLLGPTASGKSRLALELAARLPIEIVSVDSAQVYRGMDVGTAKPSKEERRRVPHHLIDLLDPDERYSAGRFRSFATIPRNLSYVFIMKFCTSSRSSGVIGRAPFNMSLNLPLLKTTDARPILLNSCS